MQSPQLMPISLTTLQHQTLHVLKRCLRQCKQLHQSAMLSMSLSEIKLMRHTEQETFTERCSYVKRYKHLSKTARSYRWHCKSCQQLSGLQVTVCGLSCNPSSATSMSDCVWCTSMRHAAHAAVYNDHVLPLLPSFAHVAPLASWQFPDSSKCTCVAHAADAAGVPCQRKQD